MLVALSFPNLLCLQGSALGEPSPNTAELGAFIESLLIDEGETALLSDW